MAAPGSWYRAGTVTVTNASATVVGVGTAWKTSATPPETGDIFTVDGKELFEIIEVTSDTSLKLHRQFMGSTAAKTTYAIIRNTSATINSRLAGQVTKALNQKQVMIDEQNAWLVSTKDTEPFTDALGNVLDVMTPHKMATSVSTAIADLQKTFTSAMASADFEADKAQNKLKYNSGFAEWGNHITTVGAAVNEGLYADIGSSNVLRMGRRYKAYTGVSRTNSPIAVVDGVEITIDGNSKYTRDNSCDINFPPAPNGTKTYDSATGVVVQHDTVEAAFAAETATNKVIVTRKDLAFLEVSITQEQTIFKPFGNHQFGASSWEGVELAKLTSLGVPQQDSAFGPWDTDTDGYGKTIASMTDAELQKALDSNSNLRYDKGQQKLIGTEYKILVDEGSNDTDTLTERMTKLGYAVKDTADPRLFFNSKTGKYAIPICLVQRLNMGAGDKTWNPFGCGQIEDGKQWYNATVKPESTRDCFVRAVNGDIASGKSGSLLAGYEYHDAIYAGLVEDARISVRMIDENAARIDAGRKAMDGTKRGKGKVPFTKFSDTSKPIYLRGNNGNDNAYFYTEPTGGSFVNWEDLGFSHNRGVLITQPATGYVGYGKTLYAQSQTPGYLALSKHRSDLGVINKGAYIEGLTKTDPIYIATVDFLTPEFDIVPMVNLIGTPEKIKAANPNGCVGGWVPKIPDGSRKGMILTKKAESTSVVSLRSVDGGVTWSAGSLNIDVVKNQISDSHSAVPANAVQFASYQALAPTTQKSDNGVVVGDVGDVFFGNSNDVAKGNRLMSSLTGEIGKNAALPGYGAMRTDAYVIEGGKLSANAANMPIHGPLQLGVPQNDSKAFKAVLTMVEEDGLLYEQWHGYAPVYTAGAAAGKDKWGDTVPGDTLTAPHGKVPVMSGEGTMTDLNGVNVKTFCHRAIYPTCIAPRK